MIRNKPNVLSSDQDKVTAPKGKLRASKGRAKLWKSKPMLKGMFKWVKGKTHCPLAIEQAITANHGDYGACQKHHPSWQVHHRVAHKQEQDGIGQKRHPCHCPPPYDPHHCVQYNSAVV